MWNNEIFTENYVSRSTRNKYFSKLLKSHFSEIKNILNVGGGGRRDLYNSLENKEIKKAYPFPKNFRLMRGGQTLGKQSNTNQQTAKKLYIRPLGR